LPAALQANPTDDAVDIGDFPTAGAGLHLTLQHVGELAHSYSDCPGPACNQTIAAGPFNCSEYLAGSFVQEQGADR